VRDKAESLGIELHFVPDKQAVPPLNRGGFGPLKRISQCLWDEKYSRNPEMRWNPAAAPELLEEAMTRLPTATLLALWDFAGTERPHAISVLDERRSLSSYDNEDDDREFKPSPTATVSPSSDRIWENEFEWKRLRHER
jgi:hypothetical protein